jgi:hypothetical protein
VSIPIIGNFLIELANPWSGDLEVQCLFIDHAKEQARLFQEWRSELPSNLAWMDQDPLARDVSIAYVRAKYYQSLYTILQPVLRIAIQTQTRQRGIVELSSLCVDAASQCILAYDNVCVPICSSNPCSETPRSRLVLPNIVATLDAQFGMMLVLTATYESDFRRQLPPTTRLTKYNLNALFRCTLARLNEWAPYSPLLSRDRDVLQIIYEDLGPLIQLELGLAV